MSFELPPADPARRAQLEELLGQCPARDATDLHLTEGEPLSWRVDGELRCEGEPLAPGVVTALAASALEAPHREVLAREGSVDLALEIQGQRFRLNVFRTRGRIALAARHLPDRIRSFAELHLPAAVERLAEFRDGLVLVTGPTGSGKTTTLATLLHAILARRPCHTVTVEDPIEYVHASGSGLIQQREVHVDVPSFAHAIRAALREDPEVILVGEMRDLETMRAALVAAETGHLVFSTLHCGDAAGAIDRLVGAFPTEEQGALQKQLSMALRAVLAQRLLRRADGPGRVPAVEVLFVTTAVANLIRTYRPQAIYSAMEAGAAQGMQTLEQSLAALVAAGVVRLEDARRIARDEKLLEDRLRLARVGGGAPWR